MRRLTTARGYDAEGSYSPDGKLIVFSSMRSGYDHPLSDKEKKSLEENPSNFAEIYVMKADGTDQKRLTNVFGYDGVIAMSVLFTVKSSEPLTTIIISSCTWWCAGCGSPPGASSVSCVSMRKPLRN